MQRLMWSVLGIVVLVWAGASCGDDDDAAPAAIDPTTTTTPAHDGEPEQDAEVELVDGDEPHDNGPGDEGADDDGPGSEPADTVDLCALLQAGELLDYAARATDAGHEVFEVLPGVETGRPGGLSECRWIVVMGLRDPTAAVVFPDAQCNEDWSRCERDIWMAHQAQPLAEVLDDEVGGPDGMVESPVEVPGFEGRSRIVPAQGTLWIDDDEVRTCLSVGLGSVADIDGTPEVVADVLAELAACYVAVS